MCLNSNKKSYPEKEMGDGGVERWAWLMQITSDAAVQMLRKLLASWHPSCRIFHPLSTSSLNCFICWLSWVFMHFLPMHILSFIWAHYNINRLPQQIWI